MGTQDQLYNSLISTIQAHGLYNRTPVENAYEILKQLKRKKYIDDIEHFLRVSLIIAKMGFTTEVIAVALLHDLRLLSESEVKTIKKYINNPEVFSIIDYYQKLENLLKNLSATTPLELFTNS